MNDILIFKTVFGSHLYGLATENSDIDYKGIYLPNIHDVILQKVGKSIRTSNKENIHDKSGNGIIESEIYSLHHFIKLALEGQTVAIDMLYSPEDKWLHSGCLWNYIQYNKNRFLSKKMNSFIGYAVHQAAKYGIKGSRLSAAEKVLDIIKRYDGEIKLYSIIDKIKEELNNHDHIYFIENKSKINEQYIEICSKKFLYNCKLKYIIEPLEHFINRYGARAKLAKDNKNIDWKAVSHGVRACYQLEELIDNKTIHFPLKESDYLVAIKKGELDYIEVAENLEKMIEIVKNKIETSWLPNKPDTKFWEEFLVNIYK